MRLTIVSIVLLVSPWVMGGDFVMKTGNALKPTPKEELLNKLKAIKTRDVEQKNDYLRQYHINQVMNALPSWALAIPKPVIIHSWIDATTNNPSYDFLRMGLLVRDMYKDYPLNEKFFAANLSHQAQWRDQVRNYIVALCFASAFASLSDESDDESTREDLIYSKILFATWALRHLELAEFPITIPVVVFEQELTKFIKEHEDLIMPKIDPKIDLFLHYAGLFSEHFDIAVQNL